ncbi:hypothetical protein JX580_05235 [Thiomicrospira microaerophila]|uniref:hypothetical protein n=1 Tax=Thiomicrospira microaerophila TaxID=406020 RepID=UPI00200C97DA|nr:hypothetical protein [Thiomicrospira microaerophila]UQB43280.1 hypothetical protein JX580_05235 [Thiomicrospira microaerophila]
MDKTKLVILHKSDNPSTDFFIRSRFSEAEFDIRVFEFSENPTAGELDGAVVVIVRYVSLSWRRLIQAHRDQIKRLVYFMDDDLWDGGASANQRWRYRLKLFLYARVHRAWLLRIGAEIKVSMPFLADKYAGCSAKVWSPQSIYHSFTESWVLPHSPVIFYHGTSSHFDEVCWLLPVFKKIFARYPNVRFEVIGDQRVSALFGGLTYVSVVPQMNWAEYRHFIQQPGRTIGLAPLLDTPFNRARAPTKLFDITAAGAVGVYADSAVYQGAVVDKENGRLVAMNHQAWVTAISDLLSNPEKTAHYYRSALSRV